MVAAGGARLPQPNGSTRYTRNIKENSSQANTGSVNVYVSLPRADRSPLTAEG